MLLSFSPTCISHTVLKIYLEVPLHNLMWWKRENTSEGTNCRVVTDNMRHTADTSTQQIALFADNLYCFGIVWHKLPIHVRCVFSPLSYSSGDLKGKLLCDQGKWNKSVHYYSMRFSTSHQCMFSCRMHCSSALKKEVTWPPVYLSDMILIYICISWILYYTIPFLIHTSKGWFSAFLHIWKINTLKWDVTSPRSVCCCNRPLFVLQKHLML